MVNFKVIFEVRKLKGKTLTGDDYNVAMLEDANHKVKVNVFPI